ncbi:pleckstrin homology domain-containing family A member 7 isoform X2 [Bombina bombina]|uniref:pleckstrin homology domain-containing family A member 7 isoform X2 n=1 Tax=Bombina bombina TaxID=8345 RepID=UPI00235AB364|nr:pleckstrin homology domain-containing family A member 7 isoform X2 [Bombina bombina]
MAAASERESLPEHWSYGVCQDGRVFFIDDQSRTTTWLHPRTGEPVNSGHMIRSDLPRGWEEGFTDEGASYFIDHNQRTTTFSHPVTGEISPENFEFDLREEENSLMSQPQKNQRPSSTVSESSTAVTTSTAEAKSAPKAAKLGNKVYSFGKRDQSIKRNPNIPVVVRGWLYKQDSSGMRLWKRRWFLLSDHCLFYYKDSREEAVLGSIPLPSYVIAAVGPEDRINRKFSFKASHTGMRAYIYQKNSIVRPHQENSGMRTYYFSADTQEDMNGWIRAMNQAALLQSSPVTKREHEDIEWQNTPVGNHIDLYQEYAKPETNKIKENYQKPKEIAALHMFEDQNRETGDNNHYIKHKDTLNSRAGKTKLILSDGESAFTNVSKMYLTQTAQPQSIERNGTLPASFRMNTTPVEQNGTDTYKRAFVPRINVEKQVQRRSNMSQVENWVKVQKGDTKGVASDHTLPRYIVNQPQHHPESHQTLPKTTRQPSGMSPPPNRHLPSDYKYAHDRVKNFKMSNEERKATKEGTVWQLYEWQQRQQFKHGSPTGQIYMDSADFVDRNRTKSLLDVPRSVSVPPSPSDIPPPAPAKIYPPRRPHTPSERLIVRPEEQQADFAYLGSPQKTHSYAFKSTSHVDRRSMPSMGYMTHTADDTYMQLKKDLEYLDLKVTGRETLKDRASKPVRVAESDVDVKLSTLCEQDRILQDLEDKIRALKDNKDKLETVLEVLHRQMDQYKDQPQHTEKISYQQRLLQEDLVQIRAEMSKVSTDMENSWNEYMRLENDVSRLRQMLQDQMNRTISSQEKAQLQKDLWRIEDVTAGLSTNKLNYKVLIESFKNPERKTVPSAPFQFVPSRTTAFTSVRSKSVSPLNPPSSLVKPPLEVGMYPQPYLQPQLLHKSEPHIPSPPRLQPMLEDGAPPRPPLPDMYSPEDPDPLSTIPPPPAVPPPPRESSVIRHTSVRGLKRQSDERKRDREHGQGVNGDYRVELRTYVSEPELANLGNDANQSVPNFLNSDAGYQTLPTRGLSGSTSRLHQSSSIASYVTLRRGMTPDSSKDRPKSAFERLYSGDNQRGRMSAEEQLQRMKRHQKALVRERKRTLSQGDRQSVSNRTFARPVSADISSWKREQEFDLQLLERAAREVEDKDKDESEWLKVKAIHVTELDLEPEDYDLDISKELSMPDKVTIPERYVELEPEEPLTTEELEARYRKVEKIKNILAKSSMQNLQSVPFPDEPGPVDLDSQMQEQERMITISYALASEASQRSKQVAAHAVAEN